MAKLFKYFNSNEYYEEELVEDPSTEQDMEEVSENATKLAVEIEEMDNVAGSVVDVIKDVAAQVADNEDKLSNPDHVVTTIDVEVSEEALKRACYSLGEKPDIVLSFANESIYNDIRNNARRYLTASTEELKNTLRRLAYKIRNMIIKVIEKLKLWYKQSELRFSFYADKIRENVDFIQSGELGWRNVWYEDIARTLLSKNRADITYMVINNETASFKLDRIDKNVYALLNVSGDGMKGGDLKQIQNIEAKYGCAPETKYIENIVGIYNNNGLAYGEVTNEYYTIKFVQTDQSIAARKFDGRKLALDMAANYKKYTKAIERSKFVFDNISKSQKRILKDIDKHMNDKNGETGYYCTREAYLRSKKSEAITCCTFLAMEYIETIKAYIDVMDILVRTAKANCR